MSPRNFTTHPYWGCPSLSTISSAGSSSFDESVDESLEESVEVTMAPNSGALYDDCTSFKRNGDNDDTAYCIEEESIEMEAPAALAIMEDSCATNSNSSSGNRVCFGSVNIRTYDVTLGTRKSGGQERGIIPLTIGWDYDEFGRWSVDEFEKQRIPERRPGGEEAIRIDRETGYRVLRDAGFTKHQILREMFYSDLDKTLATSKLWSKILSKSSRTNKEDHSECRKWIRRKREVRADF